MNKLTLSNGWEKIDLIIQKNKIILGHNILQKYKIKQILKAYFNGVDSEYRKENNIESIIKLDGEQLQLKRTGYFEVNDNYSITDDCKLGTKSILLKYFETILDDSILFDSINTIDILFESLANDLSENSIIKPQFSKMTIKQLCKLIKPTYCEDYQKDEFDMAYEEIIILQLSLIEIIQNKSLYENTIVLVDIPYITDTVYKKINDIRNAFIIVLTNNYVNSINMEEIALFENETIDLADQYYIYELFGEIYGNRKTIREVYEMIQKFIKTKYTYVTVDFVKQIELFL